MNILMDMGWVVVMVWLKIASITSGYEGATSSIRFLMHITPAFSEGLNTGSVIYPWLGGP